MTTQNVTNNFAGGKIKQMVYVNGGGGSTGSLTPVDVPGTSVTITPTSASSTILVMSSMFSNSAGVTGHNTAMFIQVLRGVTVLSATPYAEVATTSGAPSSNWRGSTPFYFIDTPATTSATTYKLQYYVSDNGGVQPGVISNATIVLMEIGA